MRIASLLPSATEIVCALGLEDQVVAVTHECDFPPSVRALPSVTRNLLGPGLASAHVDDEVRASARDAHTIYDLDADKLKALEPDIVLTQSLCEVCAVSRSAVDDAVCTMPRQARVVSLDPHALDDMLESIATTGDVLGAHDRANDVVVELRARIAAVRDGVADVGRRPRVFCAEWLDPVYRAGHWVPEQVRLAGGEDGLGREGEPSAIVDWSDVLAYEPEVIVLMPCGFNAPQAAERAGELAQRPGWDSLPAVRDGRVFAVDGSALFSRPGPRLVDGVELLAGILHPGRFAERGPEDTALRLRFEGQAMHAEPYR